MSIPLMIYGVKPVYTKIAGRFSSKYKILLRNHIDYVTRVSDKETEGITFVAKDHNRLIDALKETGAFHHDNRGHLAGQLAAAATNGEGYREIADSSLHCQISSTVCNIHIDYVGFVWRGPRGESLVGPDSAQHIVGELAWPALVQWVTKKNEFAGKILGRITPRVPSSAEGFAPRFGADFRILSGETHDMAHYWSLSIDYRHGCRDATCGFVEDYGGLNFTYRHK